jgi:ribonuclease VapC
MIVAVIDASALLALLRGESGADKVSAVLSRSAVSTVNWSEIIAFYARDGAPEPKIRELIDPLPIERMPFGESLAYVAGLMIPTTRVAGLSFGDRACLALARQLGVRAMTADRSWSRIAAAVGVEVEVIR